MGVVGLSVRRVLMPETPTAGQLAEIGQLASRWGIASILVLFLMGAILFYFVDERKGREQAAQLSAD
jgi:hypothetical protein